MGFKPGGGGGSSSGMTLPALPVLWAGAGIGTIRRPSLTRPTFVVANCSAAGLAAGIDATAFVGPTSPPTTAVADFSMQQTGTGQESFTLYFFVPVAYYYEVVDEEGTIIVNPNVGFMEYTL